VLAHDSAPRAGGIPAIENLLHLTTQTVELGQLLFQQRAHMDTGPRLRRSQVDDVADLLQREAEPACLGDEVQDAQSARVVHAIPGLCPTGFWHDAARFVQAKRSAANAAAGGDLSDRQSALGHEARIDLAV
jgi:hypothetical protein